MTPLLLLTVGTLGLSSLVSAQTPCQGRTDNSTFVSGNNTYEIQCSQDTGGGNLQYIDGLQDFAGCAAACENYTINNPIEPCFVGVVSDEGNGNPDNFCALKSRNNGPNSDNRFDSLVRITNLDTCQNQPNNSTFFAGDVEYQITCFSDGGNGNLNSTSGAGFEDCAASCNEYTLNNPNTPCGMGVVTSAEYGNEGNVCFLKAPGGGTYLNNGYNVITRISGYPVECFGKEDNTTFVDEYGITYLVSCQTDFGTFDVNGQNTATGFEDCTNQCDGFSDTVAIVLGPGLEGSVDCHCKGTLANRASSSNHAAAILQSRASTCSGKENNETFVDDSGDTYQVECYTDIPQLDINGQANATSWEDCATQCSIYPDLVAIILGNSSPKSCHCKGTTDGIKLSNVYSVATLLSRFNPNSTSSASASESATSVSVSESASVSPSVSVSESSSTVSSAESSVTSDAFPSSDSSLSTTSDSLSSPTSSVESSTIASTESETISSLVLTSTSEPSITSLSSDMSSGLVSSSGSVTTSASLTSSPVPFMNVSTTSVPTSAASSSAATSSTEVPSSPTSESSASPSTSSDTVSASVGPISSQESASSVSPSETATASASGVSSASSAAPSGASPPFKIQGFFLDLTIGFVAPDGRLVNDSTLAAEYEVVDLELFIYTASDLRRRALGGKIAADAGANSVVFTPGVSSEAISTTFVFRGFGAYILWTNQAFNPNQVATFCVSNDFVYAVLEGDTSFCDYTTQLIAVDPSAGVPTSTSAANSSVAAPTTINNYNSITTYNNIQYNVNIDVSLSIFASGNCAPKDANWFYAQLCPVCAPVQVYKADLTYAQCPCPVCPPAVYKIGGLTGSPATAGNVSYGPVSCLSCSSAPAGAPALTAVTLPCPVCPSSSTTVVVPTAAVSSIQSIASASGAAAAQSAASKALQTVTITKTSASAPSTVVNVGGSAVATIAQVSAAPVAPVSPASNNAAPAGASSAPAVQAFKGDAVASVATMTKLLSAILIIGAGALAFA